MTAPAPVSAGGHRRQALRSLAAAAMAGWGAGMAALPGPAQAAPATLGDRVPWPRVALLDGGTLTAADLHDTAVVLVFFTTTCPYCRRHNARLDSLVQATGGQPLRVIGVAGDADAAAVRDHVRQQGYRFAVTLDAHRLRPLLSQRRVVPLTCVIDRAGRLAEVIAGEMAEADVLGLARWARAV